ncbi:hypothetical protein L1D14_25570 [Vibrio tubiashii]|uniref:hypothetical protein n=1 Tax=Vibrio tubiashii TaxID=29498 RepID=UPI001EFDC745|nr:hypothetical protein [Vibrio tubiashii]MCG9579581.1 hypothetical protein [Vibrio tubiashii]
MSEAQDAQDISVTPSKSKKQMNLSTPLSIIAIVLGGLSVGGHVYSYVVSEPSQTQQIGQYINSQIAEVKDSISEQPKIDEATVESLKGQLVETVTSNVKPQLAKAIKDEGENLYNDVLIHFENNPPKYDLPIAPEVDIKKLTYSVVNELERQPHLLTRNGSTAQINQRIDLVYKEISRLEDLAKAAYNNSKSSSNKAAARAPQRLKEFNIVAPPLKDNTLFVIDAPKKNGKDNSITLTIGETFISKMGRHKVLDTEVMPNGSMRLRVSGNYFIDGQREEFTAKELAALSSKKSSAQKTPIKKSSTAIKRTTAVANKVELKGWYVITPKPSANEVVVYSPIAEAPIRLSKNKYIEGIGTVRNIDFSNGTTEFEKYFIKGRQ